jgi:glutaredoxin
MLILYVKSGCHFCAEVLAAGRELGIQFDERNIADEGVIEELVAHGGRRQTPYLIDEEKGVAMYEADAIVEYLHQRFK